MDLSSCVCGNVWLLRTSKDVSKVAIFVAGLFVYVFFFFIRFLSCQTDSEIVVLAVKMESLGFLFSFFIKKMLKDTKMKFKLINICFTLHYYIF